MGISPSLYCIDCMILLGLITVAERVNALQLQSISKSRSPFDSRCCKCSQHICSTFPGVFYLQSVELSQPLYLIELNQKKYLFFLFFYDISLNIWNNLCLCWPSNLLHLTPKHFEWHKTCFKREIDKKKFKIVLKFWSNTFVVCTLSFLIIEWA